MNSTTVQQRRVGRRGTLMVVGSLVGALAFPLAPAASAAAAPFPNQDLINKMDGGRLAIINDSLAEGAAAITLRSPSWVYRTEAWDVDRVATPGEPGGWTEVYKNRASGKCLQPASATAARGSNIIVRTCDNSDLQKWLLRPERVGGTNTGWWTRRPKVNRDVALTLNFYHDGSWATLHLDTAYPSSDRLWRWAVNNRPWTS